MGPLVSCTPGLVCEKILVSKYLLKGVEQLCAFFFFIQIVNTSGVWNSDYVKQLIIMIVLYRSDILVRKLPISMLQEQTCPLKAQQHKVKIS